MNTLPVGIQVYSVREEAEKDFAKTMKELKEIGYDYVELAGLYGIPAAKIREILDQNGLKAISAHVPYADMIADIDQVIRDYSIIGVECIAVPYMEEDGRPNAPKFAQTIENITKIGQKCKEAGIQLVYHNHDFEFVTMPDGSFGLDYLYDHVSADLLATELDTCWIKVAGQDPAAYVRKYKGRAPIVHLKDFYKEGNPQNLYELIGIETEKAEEDTGVFEFRPVGYGMQDWLPILEASVEASARYVVVEQDESVGRSRMEAAKLSREYLRSLGW